MKDRIGKPQALKEVNLSILRKIIREKGTATRAELVLQSDLSTTTVRSLLLEMITNGEVTQTGHDESQGGRRAVRYALSKERFWGLAFCLGGDWVEYYLLDICGVILQSSGFSTDDDAEKAICDFLDQWTGPVSAIGIGVPGIAKGLTYQRKNAEGQLETYPIGETIERRYGIPVVLENDLNAITMGFGCCYLAEFPEEKCENVNMAYLHFGRDCLSAGFLCGGRLLRGWNHFVGELGLFPVNGSQTLDEAIASMPPEEEYCRIVSKLLAGICCVLNPQYIAVGGESFRTACLARIAEELAEALPPEMAAEIIYAKDPSHDYATGMAYLTAEKFFSDVRLVEE